MYGDPGPRRCRLQTSLERDASTACALLLVCAVPAFRILHPIPKGFVESRQLSCSNWLLLADVVLVQLRSSCTVVL